MFKRATRGLALAALALPLLLLLLLLVTLPAQQSLREGDSLAAAGRYRQALESYAIAAQRAPWLSEPQVRAGELHLRLGELEPAAAAFRQALALTPDSCAGQAGLGRTLAAQGEQAEAAGELGAVGARCGLAATSFQAGELYVEGGQLGAAEVAYGQALAAAKAAEDAPLTRAVRLRLALVLAFTRPEEALAELSQGDPGLTMGESRLLAAARVAVTEAAAVSGAQRYALLGRAALAAGLPALAEAFLRQSVAAQPGYADAQAYLALALVAQGRVEGADEAARALALAPDDEVSRFAQAAALRQSGQPREAILALKSLLAAAPDNPTYLLELGEACADFGDYEAAVGYVAQAAGASDVAAEVLLAAARFHLDRAYLPQRAVPWAEQAHAELGDADSALALGWAWRLVGRDDEALSLLAQAAILDPRLAPAHYFLGVIYEGRGLQHTAVEHYARATDLDPLGPFGRRSRQSLVALEERQSS